MGKCCSKPQEDRESKGETGEVLLQVDPGGGGGDIINMTGGTLVVRSPGRWNVTHRGPPTTKKPTIVASPGIQATKKAAVPKGLGVEAKAGGTVVKTFHFDSSGSATESVSYDGKYSSRFAASKSSKGYVCGAVRQSASSNSFTTGTRFTNDGKRSFFSSTPSPFDQRMGKTKTETTTRTFTKDGKRFEETVEVITKEDDHGNVKTTTTTTTRAIDAFSTKEMATAIKDTKAPSGGRKSSSSSDSSPDRSKITKEKAKSGAKSGGKTGLLSKIRGGKSDDDESSDDEDEFVKDVQKYVNEYRVKHGVEKLKLNKEMNKFAKEWANKLAADDKMSHQKGSKYGENIFCLSSNTKNFKVNAEEVVGKWYSEMKEHKFGEEPRGTLLKTGHFTQMVWKDTKQMGVGRARSAAGTKVFVVANFDPQGNWMGQFAHQVPPLGGFKKLPSSGKTSLFSSKSRKSSSSSDSEAPSDEEDFAEDCVKAHNNYRKRHGAPPLKLNKKLNKYAKEWAVTIARKDVLQHRSNSEYGENLYCAWSSNPKHKIKAQEAVDSWYSEIKDFTFGREPSDLRAGHFSQVVWLDSKELGVAQARSSSGKIYVVANYSPAGNYVGSFATKVPRPVK